MRVVAGTLKGRNFDSPHSERTHPMSDKMRGAIFNILGDIEGLTVLDAFSGSGALSFEAASRGASKVVAIEIDQRVFNNVRFNVAKLGLEKVILPVKANNSVWSDNNPHSVYDIVLCDPPYDAVRMENIEKMAKHISSQGVLVLSLPSSENTPVIKDLDVVQHKKYGDAQLIFYKS